MRNYWIYFFLIFNFIAYSVPSEARILFGKSDRRTAVEDQIQFGFKFVLKASHAGSIRQQTRFADAIEKKQLLHLWTLNSLSIELPKDRDHQKCDLFHSALFRFQIGHSRAPPELSFERLLV